MPKVVKDRKKARDGANSVRMRDWSSGRFFSMPKLRLGGIDPPAAYENIAGSIHQNEVVDSSTSVFSGMNSLKRSRTRYAPVATTKSVNYKTVNRVVTLSGREFIDDVKAADVATEFKATSRLLRPTDSSLFSWLSGIARKFEEFKFLSLKFVYESQQSSTATGQVGLYFDGDPTHLPPANWNNFINTGANSHGAVWAPQTLVVPPWLYSSRATYYTLSEFGDANQVEGVPVANPTDPYENYPGLFGVVSEGYQTASSVLGKVYLEYTIQLKTQNVDGFNLTNTGGQLVSGEDAVNSGTGYFRKLSTFPVTTQYILGGPTDYTYVNAGSQYFKRVMIGGVKHDMCVQAVTVLVVCRVTAGAPVTITCEGSLYKPTPAYATLSLTTLASNGGMAQDIKDDEGAANDTTYTAQVKLLANTLFQIKTVFATGPISYAHIIITPWPFLLQA
ncbi:capsid protein [Volantivirus zuncris]|uniref:Capsid protein n=1 Tax=Crucivirus-523 TaxID=2761329 RepID=A0A7G5M3Y2_9VIRU|nr:capsid protein [Crucivirus-523]